MRLRERSYSGRSARPKPIVREEFGGEFWVIATSWGNADAGMPVVEEIVKYVSATRGDVEVTSPFEFMSCYTSEANALRVAALLSNDRLYRGENKIEYNSLVEVVALWKTDRQLSWVQCGSSQLFMKKPGQDLHPLCVSNDQMRDVLGIHAEASPLPAAGLGLESSCPLSIGSCVMEEEDQIILFSSSKIPRDIWQLTDSEIDLQKIINKIGSQMEDQPFWLGILGLT